MGLALKASASARALRMLAVPSSVSVAEMERLAKLKAALNVWFANCQNTTLGSCAPRTPCHVGGGHTRRRGRRGGTHDARTVGGATTMPATMGMLAGTKADMRKGAGMISLVSGCTADCTTALPRREGPREEPREEHA